MTIHFYNFARPYFTYPFENVQYSSCSEKTTQKYSSKHKLNNDSMVKYISLVELKSNPNYLNPGPNSSLTQKIIFILIQCIQKRELTFLSCLRSEAT